MEYVILNQSEYCGGIKKTMTHVQALSFLPLFPRRLVTRSFAVRSRPKQRSFSSSRHNWKYQIFITEIYLSDRYLGSPWYQQTVRFSLSLLYTLISWFAPSKTGHTLRIRPVWWNELFHLSANAGLQFFLKMNRFLTPGRLKSEANAARKGPRLKIEMLFLLHGLNK